MILIQKIHDFVEGYATVEIEYVESKVDRWEKIYLRFEAIDPDWPILHIDAEMPITADALIEVMEDYLSERIDPYNENRTPHKTYNVKTGILASPNP